MGGASFVSDDFAIPVELITEHISATPGFASPDWPDPSMTENQNLADLEMHHRHFDDRVGFTYTVLDRAAPTEVVGCVYMYPERSGAHDVEVRSWVVESRPELDLELFTAVSLWLEDAWPFERVSYRSAKVTRCRSPPHR